MCFCTYLHDFFILSHENNLHFNLVVAKNSNLASLGSLSYKQNTAPVINDETCENIEEVMQEKQDKDSSE